MDGQMVNIVAIFPGQGSQKVTMGKELYDALPIARSLFARADNALGLPLSTYCFEGPADKLTLTEIAQPAILTVSIAYFDAFMASCGANTNVLCAAGHSLGEYSALVAAGALEFEDAVVLVNKRGKYMQQAVPVGVGKMIAVIGKELADIEAAIAQVTDGVAQIANVNAPGQIVVAGDKPGVDQVATLLPGARIAELAVSAPFHSKLMKPAEDALRQDLATVSIKKPRFPVIANFSAKPLTDPEEIRESLALQVCGRVRWVECMQNAAAHFSPESFYEFGFGNVLTGLLKRIAPEAARTNINSLAAVSDTFSVQARNA